MNETVLPDAQAERDALDYAGMVLELLERRREDTDGREVSPSMLDEAQSAVSNFATNLDLVVSGQYTWQQVVPVADQVITRLGQWPPLKLARYLGGINSAVESFKTRVLEAADGVERRTVELDASITMLATKQAEVESAVAAERQRITEAIAKFTTDGDEAVREWTEEHEGAIKQRADAWDAAIASARAYAVEHQDRMAEYEAKSRKVLEAVGVNSTATNFGGYAEEQRTAANQWRRVAAAVFLAAGVWFIASSFPWFTGEASMWESALARLGVTAAVAGVGLYAARESSQHRRQERRAKQVQLVLTALEPFIANLDAEEQDKLRIAAAEAIFVLPGESDGGSEPDPSSGLLDLANALVAKLPDRT
ncbi:hypothetical protein KIN34_14360 [Cellulomonas sp. DKR-3]|uniref:Uncharacterized protein n=1 Tax=Cellulomonas fulva TaxID=2835530 RepID=A0ABS5U267_9CELL|nr:hypothetical protein [Cellulomonas fulva]MBT0995466.1 hypothetical protein [Cellulomonas fulva]